MGATTCSSCVSETAHQALLNTCSHRGNACVERSKASPKLHVHVPRWNLRPRRCLIGVPGVLSSTGTTRRDEAPVESQWRSSTPTRGSSSQHSTHPHRMYDFLHDRPARTRSARAPGDMEAVPGVQKFVIDAN